MPPYLLQHGFPWSALDFKSFLAPFLSPGTPLDLTAKGGNKGTFQSLDWDGVNKVLYSHSGYEVLRTIAWSMGASSERATSLKVMSHIRADYPKSGLGVSHFLGLRLGLSPDSDLAVFLKKRMVKA
jgi:hypothetical protein